MIKSIKNKIMFYKKEKEELKKELKEKVKKWISQPKIK